MEKINLKIEDNKLNVTGGLKKRNILTLVAYLGAAATLCSGLSVMAIENYKRNDEFREQYDEYSDKIRKGMSNLGKHVVKVFNGEE